MAKNKIRYSHKGAAVAPNINREYRMLPSDRFMQLLGVTRFDKTVPEFLKDFELMPSRTVISLSQHVGAPAAAAVKIGDFVCATDIVGKAANGISANLHSSIDGKVLVANGREIVIGN